MKPLSELNELRALSATPSRNLLRVASATQNGETVTIGSKVMQILTAGGTLVADRIAIDLTGSAAAKAARVGTFAANSSDGDTITVGTQVYTMKTTLTASGVTAGEVLIGADLTATRNNLVAAIMKATGGGTTYGSGTVANAAATAVATSTNALTVTAIIAGTAGNSIALAETAAQFSWAASATVLTGGTDPTAAETRTAFIAAVNTNTGVTGLQVRAGAASGEYVPIYAISGQANYLATTDTLAGSNNAFAEATMYGGDSTTNDLPLVAGASRTGANAMEIARGIEFPFNFTPRGWIVQVRTSAGAIKTWDGAVSMANNTILVNNGGSADFDNTDVVSVIAWR